MSLRLFVSASLILGTCVTGNLLAQPVKEHGQLAVQGTQLVDEHGNATVLNGVSFGWHNWWPRFYKQDTVKWLANDWKCSVVRAALGVEPKGAYLDKTDWSAETVDAVVQGAIDSGIYVIVDWHSHSIKLPEAKKYFADAARKYGNTPNVIYELFNEPVNDSWPAVKEYSIELIKTIRDIDPDNLILVGSPHWDQDIHLAADDPIQGYSNIMYTCHFYAATHGKFLRDRCDYALKKGLPIFITESAAMEASGNGPLNLREWQNWIDWCAANKIGLITWSIADKNESCSMLKPSAASEGNWKDADLKESGIRTRDLLRTLAEKNK